MHFNFALSSCRIIPAFKRERKKSFKRRKEEIWRDRLSSSFSLSELPTYGNKLMARKVTELSAACGKNKDKKPPLCFASAKKYERRW